MVYGIPSTQSFYTLEEKRLTQLSDWIYEDFQFLEFFFIWKFSLSLESLHCTEEEPRWNEICEPAVRSGSGDIYLSASQLTWKYLKWSEGWDTRGDGRDPPLPHISVLEIESASCSEPGVVTRGWLGGCVEGGRGGVNWPVLIRMYSQYELCSVGLTPLWDCSRLVGLHWRTSCRGSWLGVEVGERGGSGGHSVHHLIAQRSRDELSRGVGRVTALAQCQALHPRHQAAVRVNWQHEALVLSRGQAGGQGCILYTLYTV